jgi:hypothetical protein
MPPAHTFVKLCSSAKIAVPPKAQHRDLSFLTDAGIQNTNAPAKDIHERYAALAWARASIASAIPIRGRPRSTRLYILPCSACTRSRRTVDPTLPHRTSSALPLSSSCTTRPLQRPPLRSLACSSSSGPGRRQPHQHCSRARLDHPRLDSFNRRRARLPVARSGGTSFHVPHPEEAPPHAYAY